jgi:hypothetical protein
MSISAVATPEITFTLSDPVIRVIAIVLLTLPRSRVSARNSERNAESSNARRKSR